MADTSLWTICTLLFCCLSLSELWISPVDGLAVMSIDLGNEFMKIAIVKPGVPMEIVLNKESQRKTPTVVAIRNGERLFGEPALNTGVRYPKYAYKYLLDLLGKHYDHPTAAEYRMRFPFNPMEKDPTTGSVVFVHDDDRFTVEELLAMIIQKAKEYAETFAEQTISEAVITVPPFFNQAERRSLLRAGELAGLKVLQLLNNNAAVALNYGMFRRKAFNTTPVHYMFFDMGATSTYATVVSYKVVKEKSVTTGVSDSHPQLHIEGLGFDRTLGGREFTFRMQKHLAKAFNKVKKTKRDVTADARAMQKLFKEAGRVKHVLSANADHFAQVESLLDDEDFRVKVTREEFQEMCSDLFDRIAKVVDDAIKSSHLQMEDMSEVILMGAGTRMPRIQDILKQLTNGNELGKSVNTDEAAALGAVYQAAHLGKGFKVKPFGIKEATIYPIQVEFERAKSKDDDMTDVKSVKRQLFGRMQPYPQKKVMTFNKHVKDFGFEVLYGDLGFLSTLELALLGNTSLMSVTLSGVEAAHNKHAAKGESKGVKAHFKVDESGVLSLDKVESVFETLVQPEESTLSKIGNSISYIFGGKTGDTEDGKADQASEDGKKTEEVDENKPEEAEQTDEQSSGEKNEPATEQEKEETVTKQESEKTAEKDEKSKDNKSDDKKVEGKNETEKLEDKKEEDKKPKLAVVREEITVNRIARDMLDPTEEQMKKSQQLIDDLKKRDTEKSLLEKAKNDIEAFIIDARDRLEQRDYKLCSTEEERVAIGTKLGAASDWLMEQEYSTPRKSFEEKLKELKSSATDLFDRVRQKQERPRAIEALNSIVNHTEFFLRAIQNLTGEDQPFTEVEVNTLSKLINETKDWNRTMTVEQKSTPLTVKPKMLVEDIAMKIAALDRELKYLINKAKLFRPKPKVKPADTNKSDTGNTTDSRGSDTINLDVFEEEKAKNETEEKTPKKVGGKDGDDDDDDDEKMMLGDDAYTDDDSKKTHTHLPPDEL